MCYEGVVHNYFKFENNNKLLHLKNNYTQKIRFTISHVMLVWISQQIL